MRGSGNDHTVYGGVGHFTDFHSSGKKPAGAAAGTGRPAGAGKRNADPVYRRIGYRAKRKAHRDAGTGSG